MSFYQKLKPFIFKFDAERMHNVAMSLMHFSSKFPLLESYIAKSHCCIYEELSQNIHGLKFYNPIGLASGFDKNAEAIRPLASLGFSFLELGSITQMPQDGNPKPRIFRHIEQESVQNALGFNNKGARGVLANLQKNYPFCIPIGINIGKNKNIVMADSLKNYELSLETLKDYGDYFTFNLSSPNTPGLRDLQNESFVVDLLDMAHAITTKPLFIKISPDMEIDSMLRVCQKAIEKKVSGIIATNTTIDYSLVPQPAQRNGHNIGGLSGKVLTSKSREILKILGQNFFRQTTLISVGGIASADEIYERLRLGASLVQIMTSMVYGGPSVVKHMNIQLHKKLEADGIKHIRELIGTGINRD
ncbi:dihydroorotate dehydrogenase (quinone) [Helicobacter didelphidarum]|uniref:Dihydroorotate dehydrogenase (quinone) n=1 Tax=Helicobacter didelphidarum TaxID=2040648 RepID=A0A3D8IN75_9HELI|nr:dihydroorotate dehydrogenase (quinone) [Helicobacter didelphidarum]RDU66084.1 dihydroorotate dehydrogenase (quinone) [Helicobacter didelphidarum]